MIEKTDITGMQNHRNTKVSTKDVLTGNLVIKKYMTGKATIWIISPYKNRKMVAAFESISFLNFVLIFNLFPPNKFSPFC
jgi:hypothetical protein